MNMIYGSKNKGDWSELYVLLYLLGTRKLYAADENLNRIGAFCFPIKRIMRHDAPARHIDFVLDGINRVKIYFNTALTREMTSEEFKNEAEILYEDIVRGRGSFNIPHAERFLNDISLNRLAAPSNDVTDIKMELHDTITGIDQIMGFSIKSYIGGAPTLLNASGATNFIYEITGLTDEEAKEINSINTLSKIRDRMRRIFDFGGTVLYQRTANRIFSANLMMIDSCMEYLLSEVLLYSYTSGELDCVKIIEHLEAENPLDYPRRGLYTHKFKLFLCAKALGMEPGSEWSGEDDASGGYIVAKADGDVLAYHLYNRDKFKQYLLENTKLERGSTSKHKYASIYKMDGRMYINLNLQIRFK